MYLNPLIVVCVILSLPVVGSWPQIHEYTVVFIGIIVIHHQRRRIMVMDYQLQINCQKYVHSSPECRSHISSSNDVVSTFYQSWRLLISSGTTFTNGINYKLPNWITWVCISWRSSFSLHTCCIETLADIFCIFLIDNVLANSVNAFCPWQSVYSFLLPTLLPLSRVRNTIVGKTCQMSKEKESTRIV